MRIILLLSFLFLCLHVSAQKIHGTVFNDKGDLLPYASVTIKGTTIGSSATNKARFSISVKPGTYTLVCQHVGYTKQEKTVTVNGEDVEVTFIISEQKLDLKEVIVKSGAEDPAYAIIRKAIKKRSYYNSQVDAFECDLYTKDIMRLRKLPKKILGQKIPDADRQDMGLDSSGKGIIYLAESVARIHSQLPDKFKMEVLSSRVSGSDGFGFTFPTFISMYRNNVNVFTDRFNPRGFVSPIADNALSLYKYKYLGSFYEDGKEINSIQVIPRRTYEPVFSGTINITEDDWRIHSFDLLLTKSSQLEIIDTLHITQIHVPVSKDVWRVKNQHLHFNFKQFGIDAIGDFVSIYSNYNINLKFDKKFFDRTIIKYDTAVNKRPKAYWDTIRPVPLEPEERKDYAVKDSIFDSRKDSAYMKQYADSMNKRQGKLKPWTLLWKRMQRTKYLKDNNSYSWSVEGIAQGLEYNTVEGVVVNVMGAYDRHIPSLKSNLSIDPLIRYGFSNGHLNPSLSIVLRTRDWATDKKLRRQTWSLSGGKRVSQFNKDNPITPLANSISTLLWKKNYMKIYENYFVSLGFSKRYESGFRFAINTLYEDRLPLNNTTDFTIFKRDSLQFTPNYPYEKINAQFPRHQAFIVSADISIKPGQRYIQFPNGKMSLGSNYPTFSLNYTKGIENVFGSDVNFDKWRFTVSDDKNFKLLGLLKYRLGIGGFLNSNKVFIQDYQHFNGNRTLQASAYVNSFQLAEYYGNSTTASFYSFGHLEHHFNGLLTNKIPLFKRLNWYLVAGSNAFYVNKDNNYVEVFAGLENIFKLLRVDIVGGYINGNRGYTGIRLGTGGIIGGSVRADRRSRTLNISL
jgi:hypothetical protein